MYRKNNSELFILKHIIRTMSWKFETRAKNRSPNNYFFIMARGFVAHPRNLAQVI